MLTVLEAIRLSTDFLEKKGISEARTNAELLLAEILNCKRLELYLSFERPLSNDEKNKYRSFIARRGKFEPLQYITGTVEFMGLHFKVSRDVLIPRPETEILVERIIEQSNNKNGLTILDVGTGSGNIAVSLSKHISNSKILAIDKSEEALKLARENAILNDTDQNIEFRLLDIFNLSINNKFDIIVSNPPYVDEEQYNTLQKEIVAFEPRMAVTDFDDGFNFYRKISELAKHHLNKNGKLFYEVGIGQSEKVKEIMEGNNFTGIKIEKDYSGIERVIFGEIL